MSITVIVGILCAVGVVGVLLLVGVLFLISKAGGRDTVSTARADWISRRSDSDERDW